ncbi:MAG TPA: hypothetical protein VN638_09285 [Nitrospiraceae bacterium]|nr:hypothetical protein [Nitrospiraceae bacterium]
MKHKVQDIRGIVKQRGESGRLKTIILPTHPTLARRDAPCPKQGRRGKITGGVPSGYARPSWSDKRTLPQAAQKVRPARPKPTKAPEA